MKDLLITFDGVVDNYNKQKQINAIRESNCEHIEVSDYDDVEALLECKEVGNVIILHPIKDFEKFEKLVETTYSNVTVLPEQFERLQEDTGMTKDEVLDLIAEYGSGQREVEANDTIPRLVLAAKKPYPPGSPPASSEEIENAKKGISPKNNQQSQQTGPTKENELDRLNILSIEANRKGENPQIVGKALIDNLIQVYKANQQEINLALSGQRQPPPPAQLSNINPDPSNPNAIVIYQDQSGQLSTNVASQVPKNAIVAITDQNQDGVPELTPESQLNNPMTNAIYILPLNPPTKGFIPNFEIIKNWALQKKVIPVVYQPEGEKTRMWASSVQSLIARLKGNNGETPFQNAYHVGQLANLQGIFKKDVKPTILYHQEMANILAKDKYLVNFEKSNEQLPQLQNWNGQYSLGQKAYELGSKIVKETQSGKIKFNSHNTNHYKRAEYWLDNETNAKNPGKNERFGARKFLMDCLTQIMKTQTAYDAKLEEDSSDKWFRMKKRIWDQFGFGDTLKTAQSNIDNMGGGLFLDAVKTAVDVAKTSLEKEDKKQDVNKDFELLCVIQDEFEEFVKCFDEEILDIKPIPAENSELNPIPTEQLEESLFNYIYNKCNILRESGSANPNLANANQGQVSSKETDQKGPSNQRGLSQKQAFEILNTQKNYNYIIKVEQISGKSSQPERRILYLLQKNGKVGLTVPDNKDYIKFTSDFEKKFTIVLSEDTSGSFYFISNDGAQFLIKNGYSDKVKLTDTFQQEMEKRFKLYCEKNGYLYKNIDWVHSGMIATKGSGHLGSAFS